MLTNPESPTFLLQKNDYKAADAAGERLWGSAFKGELYGAAGSIRDASKQYMKGDIEDMGAAAKDAGKQIGQSLKQGGYRNTEAEGVYLRCIQLQPSWTACCNVHPMVLSHICHPQ